MLGLCDVSVVKVLRYEVSYSGLDFPAFAVIITEYSSMDFSRYQNVNTIRKQAFSSVPKHAMNINLSI